MYNFFSVTLFAFSMLGHISYASADNIKSEKIENSLFSLVAAAKARHEKSGFPKVKIFGSNGRLNEYFIIVDLTDPKDSYIVAGAGDRGYVLSVTGAEATIDFREAKVSVRGSELVLERPNPFYGGDFFYGGEQVLKEIQYTDEDLRELSSISIEGIFASNAAINLSKKLKNMREANLNVCNRLFAI